MIKSPSKTNLITSSVCKMRLTCFAAALACAPAVFAAENPFEFSTDLSTVWSWESDLQYQLNPTNEEFLTKNVSLFNQTISFDLGGSEFSITPAENYYAVAVNPNSLSYNVTNGYNIDGFLGFQSPTFESTLLVSGDNSSQPTNVAAIKRTVQLQAGTSYTFYWAYAAQDYDPYKDGVFFSYTKSGTGQLVILARNGPTDEPYISEGSEGYPEGTVVLGNYGSTSWNKYTFTVSEDGEYVIALGSFNASDEGVDPVLFVSGALGGLEGDVFTVIPLGPNAADTLESMRRNGINLRKIFGLMASAVNPGLSQDCTVFDAKGICVAFTGKHAGVSGSSADMASGALTVAYKVNPNVRIGGYIEQRIGNINTTGIRVDNNNPDFGIFGGWSEKEGGEGLQFRAAYRYGNKNISITREVVGTSEAGVGESDLKTQGLQFTVGKGYRLNSNLLATPYVGVRQITIERKGYTEASSISSPLTYANLKQKSTQALLGVNFSGQVAPKVSLNAAIGLEHDLSHKTSDYSATGVTDLESFQFNDNIQKTRPVVAAGLTYSIDKTKQISGQVVYREEAFTSTATTTTMLTFTAGF